MKNKIDIDIKAFCHNYDCHISYRINEFERSHPEILGSIVKMIEANMDQYITQKETEHERQA